MKVKRLLLFHKREWQVLFLVICTSLLLSNFTYLQYAYATKSIPNLWTWLVVIFQDITVSVYVLPIVLAIFLTALCLKLYYPNMIYIRFQSMKEISKFFNIYLLVNTCIMYGLTIFLIVVISFLNGLSFSYGDFDIKFLQTIYGIRYIKTFGDMFCMMLFNFFYMLFIEKLTLLGFHVFNKSNFVLAFISSFIIGQSIFLIYPIGRPIINYFPIYHYLFNDSAPRLIFGMIYWIAILLFLVIADKVAFQVNNRRL